MRIFKAEYVHISNIIRYLLEKRKVRLKGDVFTVLGNEEIELEKGGKIVKELEIIYQCQITDGKNKFNWVVNNLKIDEE